WSLVLLLSAVHFWWFEFALRQVQVWYFGFYLVILFYAFMLFLMASLLFPDVSHEHSGNEDYFMDRRAWFFAIFALTYGIDLLDTWIKGRDYFVGLGLEYRVRAGLAIAVAAVAALVRTPRMVAILGGVWLLYDLSWIFRRYDIL
ncbi:MAG TPA: hypothetical protein VGC31_02435, partial [Paenirhodobacter sp.]